MLLIGLPTAYGVVSGRTTPALTEEESLVFGRPKISPVPWHPTPAPKGPDPRPLGEVRRLRVPGSGPEDTLIVGGHLYTGVEDGRILRMTLDGRRIDVVANTSGRPLGIEEYIDGRIVVCDAEQGLLLLDAASGAIRTLVPRGKHDLRICNNAAVGGDGTIYFSDSTQRFDLEYYTADLIEHSGTGRLLRRTPDGDVDVLLDGLHFANGVALAPDESYVVVAQTGSYELTRLWLTGPRRGASEVFGDILPAFPDNLSIGSDGLIWIAMASLRKAALDRTSSIPLARKLIWALPEVLHPKPDKIVWVRAVDSDGTLVHDLYGTDDDFYMVTGVREHDGRLYLGSLTTSSIGVVDLPG